MERECDKCKHKINGTCEKWDCEFEAKERMTLDEAIKHCEKVAEKQRSKAHVYEDMMVFNQTIKHNSEAEYYEELMNECIECAEEYRQFAEWLRELQA